MAKIKITELLHSEKASGILLILSLIIAVFAANIPFIDDLYQQFVFYPITLGLGAYSHTKPLIQIVNDGLMTLFFMLIGLELKYHLVLGEFKHKETLILPTAAAIGGIVVPALCFFIFNYNSPETLKGWAIPIATDTAFMLAILSFFSKFRSNQLRAFIIGFSLIDDALALIILAIFYSKGTGLLPLFAVCVLICALMALNYYQIRSSFYYLSLGLLLWFAMVESGIHGTLAGVVVALCIPIQHNESINPSFYELEHSLKPIVYFGILPLFAFINSGVSFHDFSINLLLTPLSLGIISGLFIGKQLGIFLFSYLAVSLKYCTLPENICWPKLYAISILGGIGFTLSLFIGDISFEAAGPNYIMRMSVIIASLLSALFGVFVLLSLKKRI